MAARAASSGPVQALVQRRKKFGAGVVPIELRRSPCRDAGRFARRLDLRTLRRQQIASIQLRRSDVQGCIKRLT
jgi:hypothetical protein